MKDVIILRGVSGSGKSTAAEVIANRHGWVICCADDYFVKDGVYTFDWEKLNRAHDWCFEVFMSALREPYCEGIVIANTNTRPREMRPYEEAAAKYGARVIRLVVENTHGNKSVHGVDEVTLEKQENRLRQNLTLR